MCVGELFPTHVPPTYRDIYSDTTIYINCHVAILSRFFIVLKLIVFYDKTIFQNEFILVFQISLHCSY